MTMQLNTELEPSEEQLDIIEDHLLFGAELGVVPDERVFLYKQLHKKFYGAKIVSANLDLKKLKWFVIFEI